MASSIIKDSNLGYVDDNNTISRAYRIGENNGTLSQKCCYRIGNIVSVSASLSELTNITGNGAYFNLPYAYRPRAVTYCVGYIESSGGSYAPVLVKINTNGDVSINYSSGNIPGLYFSATYPI